MELMLIILILTAGPLIGSFLGVMMRPSKTVLYHMLAFSAGVMIAISMLELIPESIKISSILVCIIGLLCGALVMVIFGKFLRYLQPEENCKCDKDLFKTAIFIFAGIFLHNIPEGMAVAIGTISGTGLTISIAIAIAIHDIPESICTSVPYYYCVKNRFKAFLVSISVIIPTLVGFFIGKYFYQVIPLTAVGFMIALTAGSMIFISADELIPSSCAKLSKKNTGFSFMLGIAFVIALGLFI